MFRKPKRKAKQGWRRKDDADVDETDAAAAAVDSTSQGDHNASEDETSELLLEARKRVKMTTGASSSSKPTATTKQQSSSDIMHSYQYAKDPKITNADLATSTAEHLPQALIRHAPNSKTDQQTDKDEAVEVGKGADGIFRNKQRNKFHAGPIKAAQNVRVTARFDYEPNICKDYKETGFCGFGDTCIYLHDRGDTMSGWQLEQQWEEQQRKKKEDQQKEMQQFVDTMTDNLSGKDSDNRAGISTSDGLPFACHLCREYFKDPVCTTCNHYFCESCIMNHVRTANENCPVCYQATGSVFNQPTKLIAKKRKLLGIAKAKAENSWEEYAKAFLEKKANDGTS